MSLVCFKNCRESAMLLDIPADQLLQKKVFDEKKQTTKDKPIKDNSENEEDPPYLPWNGAEDHRSHGTKSDAVARSQVSKENIKPTSSWGRVERSNDGTRPISQTSYDSDEFAHVNLYSKKVIPVVKKDEEVKAFKSKDGTGKKEEKKNEKGLLTKFGKSLSRLFKLSDSKESKDPIPENGYEAGESASESNFSILSESKLWSLPYDRRSYEERSQSQTPTFQSHQDFSSLNSFDSGVVDYRGTSLDGRRLSSISYQSGVPIYPWTGTPIEYATGGSYDGNSKKTGGLYSYGGEDSAIDTAARMTRNGGSRADTEGTHWSIPSDGSLERSSMRHWSTREPRSSTRPRGLSGADRNGRKYASTGNLSSYSSSAESNRGSGSFTRYRSSQAVNRSSKLGSSTSSLNSMSNSSSRMESSRSLSRRNWPTITSNERTHESEMMEFGNGSYNDNMSSVKLNLDFDYKSESSRLYVILKSMHGLTTRDRRTGGKSNVRVHLVVMPERNQRAYTRRKIEGWTVRFMEKFRFSDINTLNSIAFKVVLNDGSAKERLIGSKAINLKDLILSKEKQSLTLEINQYN
ncbi:uncharacterized protein [Antedon mediterranea]|uniref:uncharacterized protein n=1 Tax=Antedon mediterranea TaxID=105859 RepID=UPI003AF4FCA9